MRFIYVFAPLIVFMLLHGNAPKDFPQEETPVIEEIKEPEPPKDVESIVVGTVLKKRTPLHIMGRDNKMHDILTLTDGNEVQILYVNSEADIFLKTNTIHGTENNETENKENVSSEKFFHAIYDNVDFWISEKNFAPDSMAAVVIRKTALFDDAELNIPHARNQISFGSYIARERSDAVNGVSKIYYYDKNQSQVLHAYTKSDNISTINDDIQMMKIIDQLKVTSRATPRNELFKKAQKYKPCKEITAEFEAQKTGIVVNSYQEVLKAMPKTRYGVNVPELMTVDQSKDPFQ